MVFLTPEDKELIQFYKLSHGICQALLIKPSKFHMEIQGFYIIPLTCLHTHKTG